MKRFHLGYWERCGEPSNGNLPDNLNDMHTPDCLSESVSGNTLSHITCDSLSFVNDGTSFCVHCSRHGFMDGQRTSESGSGDVTVVTNSSECRDVPEDALFYI